MMEEILPLLKSPGGMIGGSFAGVMTMLWMFRKFTLGDKVEAASAQAQVDIIQRLGEVADRAEKRAAEAEARADLAYRERNDAYLKIGELTAEVRQLRDQVEDLQRKLNV
jgi:hypothetical protein